MTTTALPALPDFLPRGFTRADPVRTRPDTTKTPPHPAPVPLSGVLHTVTSAASREVHLHRADYQRPTPHGGFTIHGYAWRCPTCPRLSRGYEPREFARALRDARAHDCGARRG